MFGVESYMGFHGYGKNNYVVRPLCACIAVALVPQSLIYCL